MKLKKALASLIEWERVCRVATVGEAGLPHLVPVCHVVADGKRTAGEIRKEARKPRRSVTYRRRLPRAAPAATVAIAAL